jgi:hypothetical protein
MWMLKSFWSKCMSWFLIKWMWQHARCKGENDINIFQNMTLNTVRMWYWSIKNTAITSFAYFWFQTLAMFWMLCAFLLGNSPASEFYVPTFCKMVISSLKLRVLFIYLNYTKSKVLNSVVSDCVCVSTCSVCSLGLLCSAVIQSVLI